MAPTILTTAARHRAAAAGEGVSRGGDGGGQGVCRGIRLGQAGVGAVDCDARQCDTARLAGGPLPLTLTLTITLTLTLILTLTPTPTLTLT